ncbi:MAG: Yip1 family protein [Acetatifactor sp.]|nr:Yip1 family protein [Acetatifactor sp.]
MRESLKLAVMILFHPIAAFEYMKRKRETISGLVIPAVIFLAAAVQIFSIYVTHYPLSTVNLRNANVVFECAKILLPVVTWGVASYAMTTILDGETKFSESMLATCYAMIPFLLISPLLTLFSRILDLGQSGLYYGMYGAMLFWIIALLLTALKEMNHYSVGKTAVVTFLSLFTMMLIWASAALLFSLSMQFITFVKEVIVEARYLFS